MSVDKSRPHRHRDQEAATSAVARAGAPGVRGHSPGIDARIDADLAFLAMSRVDNGPFGNSFSEVNMLNKRPRPPRPDRIRSIHGSFSWIDHRFLRQGFDQGLTRLEKLLYFVLIAVSNRDGVSFYSDERLAEVLEIHHAHELIGARNELVARDLIAFQEGLYQVLNLPPRAADCKRNLEPARRNLCQTGQT
jgi:hypothetical protein